MILLLTLFVIIPSLLYLYGTRTFGYWKKKSVKHDTPLAFFGNNAKQFVQKATMCMLATETYNKYPEERVVGFYRGTMPELLIRDPQIAKRILQTDFQHFHARGIYPPDTNIEPLLQNLFFADGDLWRLMRQRFTPAFSTGKLKSMFHIITDRAQKLQTLAEEIANKDEYDMRELMARYTTEFIGACGFGINMDSLSQEHSQFRKLGKRMFQRTSSDALRAAMKYVFPWIFTNLHLLTPEIETSMNYIVGSVMKERNYQPASKNDFIDLMLELKTKGEIVGQSIETKEADGSPKTVALEMNDSLIISQILLFFAAGFETSSTASSYTLHQLAFNPECQKKAQEEVDTVLAKYEGKLTYEAINEMRYLEMAFFEGMRMYPSVGFLLRKCCSPTYTIPEINVTIEKGIRVMIPVQAMHRDKMYFHEPNKFNPERFRKGIQDLKNIFLPFGEGPRSCVGARMGQMQSMAGIAAILQKFTVEPAASSVRDPLPDPTVTIAEGFLGGLPLKLRKRTLN